MQKLIDEKAEAAAEAADKETERTSREPIQETVEYIPKDAEPATQEAVTQEPETFESISVKSKDLYKELLSKLTGQDDAVMKFVRGYFNAIYSSDGKQAGPRGVFILAGGEGTGKSYLASTAADFLGIPNKRFDFQIDSTSAIKTEAEHFANDNPNGSLFIIDNYDPFDAAMLNYFAYVFGTGNFVDGAKYGTGNFKNSIFILTTRMGEEIYNAPDAGRLSAIPQSVMRGSFRSEIVNGLQGTMPPALAEKTALEFCDSLKKYDIILFEKIRIRHLLGRVQESLEEFADDTEAKYGFNCLFDPQLPALILNSAPNVSDMITASWQTRKVIKNELFEIADLRASNPEMSKIKTIVFEVDKRGASEDITPLFDNEGETTVLVICDEANKDSFVSTESVKYVFATEFEEIKSILKGDVSYIFLDPYLGIESSDVMSGAVALEDSITPGMDLLLKIRETGLKIHIYGIDSGKGMREPDYNYMLRSGSPDIIMLDGKNDVSSELSGIADDELLERKCRALRKKNGYISYKSAQTIDENDETVLHVGFYDMKVSIAPDSYGDNMFLGDMERPATRFEDVIGAENAKAELQYFIKYLRDPRTFMLSGSKPPKGVLLYGPPGTGKTMLARAMAGESNVTFIQTSAAHFKNKWVGESERNVRELFRKARQFAPSIIFIDEIDAVGKQRTGSETSVHTEELLNALLVEMDGFTVDVDNPVFVLAATNFGVGDGTGIARDLDEALLRRFDNKIKVDLPNKEERAKYVRLMVGKIKNNKVTEDAVNNLADRTTGQSLAIVQNIIDLGLRNAIKAGVPLDDDILVEALDDYNYGEKRDKSRDHYESTAIHESGHAVISYLAGEMPSYITIVSRNDFGGYMQHSDDAVNKSTYSVEELIWRIRISLGGRAAEKVFYGDAKAINTGASSDLQNASNLAMRMLTTYGMFEDRMVTLPFDAVMKSSLAKEYVDEANNILKRELAETVKLIEENKVLVEKLSKALLESNDLTGGQIEAILTGKQE